MKHTNTLMGRIVIGLTGIVVGYGIHLGLYGIANYETSYESIGIKPRYVRNLQRPLLYQPTQISSTPFELQTLTNIQILKNMIPSIEEIITNSSINETIWIYFEDSGNQGATVTIANGKISVESGILDNQQPTISVQLSDIQLKTLESIVSDAVIDNNEKYIIADVLIVPMLQRLYQLPIIVDSKNLSASKFDNIMQFEIVGGSQVNNGYPLELAATIVIADGQMFAQHGRHGNPDVRYTMTYDQAINLYLKITIQLSQATTQSQIITIAQDIANTLTSYQTYTRSDHQ